MSGFRFSVPLFRARAHYWPRKFRTARSSWQGLSTQPAESIRGGHDVDVSIGVLEALPLGAGRLRRA